MKKPKPQKTLLQRKIDFARKHWRVIGGEPFEIEPGTWLHDEYWRPLHSFRVTPTDKARLCQSCAAESGQLVERYTRPGCTRSSPGCAGVRCEPIQFVFLDLPRRSGKTVGTSGYVAASLFRGEGERIEFISGSEDQSGGLFEDHYASHIRVNPALDKRSRIVGNEILVWKTAAEKRKSKEASCRFAFKSTSISGTTGGKNTIVVLDESRAIPADVAAALLPSIWDQNGWQCPNGVRGHTKTTGDLDDQNHPTKCTTCGAELEPWVGKLLAMSSAGEMNGGLKDWFFEACDVAEKEPHPRVHVYRASGVVNKRVAESSVNATASFLGKVESMRDFIDIETSNQARRRGEDFLTHAEIAAVVDKSLRNSESGDRPGVAFLDTSDTTELTSLVILEDDSVRPTDAEPDLVAEAPWSRLAMVRLDVWEPRKRGRRMEAAELEDHLSRIVPLFKLLRLRIDDRHAPWVRNMVARLKETAWGRSIVVGCTTWTKEDRRLSWNEAERRVLGKTVRIQDHAILRKELKAARKFFDAENRMDVREVSRKVRHLDIAEGFSGACYDVHSFATKRRTAGMGDVLTPVENIARRMVQGSTVRERIANVRESLTRDLRFGPESY